MSPQDLKQIKTIISEANALLENSLEKRLNNKLEQELLILRHDIKADIDQAVIDVVSSADHAKADREEVEELDRRVTVIEKTLDISPK